MGLRAGLDRCGKSRPLPGFDPRTAQPVGSRYTDYATRPTSALCNMLFITFLVPIHRYSPSLTGPGRKTQLSTLHSASVERQLVKHGSLRCARPYNRDEAGWRYDTATCNLNRGNTSNGAASISFGRMVTTRILVPR